MVGILRLPLLSVAELLMSPVMKDDSCFLTVSFHILLIRLCSQTKREQERSRKRIKRETRQRKNGQRQIGAAIMKAGIKEERHDDKRGKERW